MSSEHADSSNTSDQPAHANTDTSEGVNSAGATEGSTPNNVDASQAAVAGSSSNTEGSSSGVFESATPDEVADLELKAISES
jgi:hypothetical protein